MLRFLATDPKAGDNSYTLANWDKYVDYLQNSSNMFGCKIKSLALSCNLHDTYPISACYSKKERRLTLVVAAGEGNDPVNLTTISYHGAFLSRKDVVVGQRTFNDRRYQVDRSEFFRIQPNY